VLFIDGRKLGTLIQGSRKQKELSAKELERMATAYRQFARTSPPEAQPGFSRAVNVQEIRDHGYALTPGRYVGSQDPDDLDEAVDETVRRLTATLLDGLDRGDELTAKIRSALSRLAWEAQ
jgi:type I restriction enzyme M protein